jgi:glycosyltransferase involved in cell wall biosynthesis
MTPLLRGLDANQEADVIPMGTDLRTLFVPPADPFEREPEHIVFVGRLVEKKGVRYLLDAVAAIAPLHPRLQVTIAGDGPLKEELQRQASALGIAKRVCFVGSVKHSDLPTLFRRATLAVFPFIVAADGDQEGFGLVVVEAMGCACPVIAGDLPALHHTIESGITGTLTPPADVSSLAQAIHTHLENPSLRVRLARTALITVRERFDWPVIAERYFSLFHNIGISHNDPACARRCPTITPSHAI